MTTQIKPDIWENDLLTVKEVAIYLRVSRVTVWRWCQQGVIPASRIGHHWRIRRASLLELFENSQASDLTLLQPGLPSKSNGDDKTDCKLPLS